MSITANLDSVQFGALLKTALDAVVVMKPDGTVAGWNDVAHRVFGWSFSEVVGKRMSELVIPERYRAAHEAGLSHFLLTGEGPVLDRHFEIEALHRDGHEIPIELSITKTKEFGEPVFLGFLRDISDRRDNARRQALLIAELNHRAKNLLGVVGAIAHQTVRASTSLDEFAPSFMGRLASLGRAHEILTAGAWESASLGELASAVLESFTGEDQRATLAGPEVTLQPRQFLSFSMILHELTTNAIKYGALSSIGGSVALEWKVSDNVIRVNWRETCNEQIYPPLRAGFGSKMILLNVRHDLRGHADYVWHNDGLELNLTFNGG